MTCLAVSLLTLAPAFASYRDEVKEPHHIEPRIGIGAGSAVGASAVGALVAGPAGIIVGAFAGGLIGQDIANEDQNQSLRNKNSELENKLAVSNQKLASLENTSSHQAVILNDAHLTIERLLTQNQELRNHTFNFDVQFRTDSTHIEKQYQDYLASLAHALNDTSNIEIEVAGFADRIGDENYNMELSKQRAYQVKDFLIQHGINKDRIITLAHGENQPLHPEESLENNFFDRRVTIYLRPAEIGIKNIDEEIAAKETKLSVAKNK